MVWGTGFVQNLASLRPMHMASSRTGILIYSSIIPLLKAYVSYVVNVVSRVHILLQPLHNSFGLCSCSKGHVHSSCLAWCLPDHHESRYASSLILKHRPRSSCFRRFCSVYPFHSNLTILQHFLRPISLPSDLFYSLLLSIRQLASYSVLVQLIYCHTSQLILLT